MFIFPRGCGSRNGGNSGVESGVKLGKPSGFFVQSITSRRLPRCGSTWTTWPRLMSTHRRLPCPGREGPLYPWSNSTQETAGDGGGPAPVSSVSEQAVFALLQLLLKRRIIADSKDLKKGT